MTVPINPSAINATNDGKRQLNRREIPLLWEIDRDEKIDSIFVVENNQLIQQPVHVDLKGWPKGEAEKDTVNFYLQLGCQLCESPDKDLFSLEPQDIHLTVFR